MIFLWFVSAIKTCSKIRISVENAKVAIDKSMNIDNTIQVDVPNPNYIINENIINYRQLIVGCEGCEVLHLMSISNVIDFFKYKIDLYNSRIEQMQLELLDSEISRSHRRNIEYSIRKYINEIKIINARDISNTCLVCYETIQ
jgi:hypothetical protein